MKFDFDKLESVMFEEYQARLADIQETIQRLIESEETIFFEFLKIDRMVLYRVLQKAVPDICTTGNSSSDEYYCLENLASWYVNCFLDDSYCSLAYERYVPEPRNPGEHYVRCNKSDKNASPIILWGGNEDDKLTKEEALKICLNEQQIMRERIEFYEEVFKPNIVDYFSK